MKYYEIIRPYVLTWLIGLITGLMINMIWSWDTERMVFGESADIFKKVRLINSK